MKKYIDRIHQLIFKRPFPGLEGVDMFENQYPIEPFLVVTEYYMDRQVFGPHPHAGISVITYMLPDSPTSFLNRDSNGDHSEIEPGGLHITQAGSGIHHDEFPLEKGGMTHGFQIWINHKKEDRNVPPKAMHAKASEIPEINKKGSKIRILHGSYEGIKARHSMVTPVTLFDVFLEPDTSTELKAEEMAFVYGIKGNGFIQEEEIGSQALATFKNEGTQVKVKAGSSGFNFLFASGTPTNEPIIYGGPFVMTSHEQMAETRGRLASGKMGILEPYIY